MSHVMVTGASSGLGAEIARLAALRGYPVSLMARRSGLVSAENLAAEITTAGGAAGVVCADVTNEAEIVAAFEASRQARGPLSALVNSAGVSTPASPAELDAGAIAETMAINVTGLMICCREAIRQMSTERGGAGGSIVNISSMAATIGGRPGSAVYSASKAAVDAFTTGIARDLATEGIRVNAIRPGVIATRMNAHLTEDPEFMAKVAASIPMGRVGNPSEIAEVALWLMSSAASFVTGAHINAGGGGFKVPAST